jgi:hypothetical protein
MLNLRQQANVKFDKNMYDFEKKRQLVDNKVKEKEILEKEKEKLSNNNSNQGSNKNLVNINDSNIPANKSKPNSHKKIQINFQNSFVTQQTHEKYDKIIESNIKKNNEKYEKMIEKEMLKVENVMNMINRVESAGLGNTLHNAGNKTLDKKNNSDKILKEIISIGSNDDTVIDQNQTENKNENYLVNDTNNQINITDVTSNNLTRINNTNNDSEMILIEEVSYFKNKLNDTSLNIGGGIIKDNNTSHLNSKFQIFPIIDETIKCESEAEEDIKQIREERESDILIKEEVIIQEEPECEDLKTQVLVTNNNTAISNKNKYLPENNVINSVPYTEKKNYNKIYEETYDQFLEDTVFDGNQLNKFIHKEKDSMQELLRAQMKNIASNIKDRKKDKECVINEKKKNLLNNILCSAGKSDPYDVKPKHPEVITFGKNNLGIINNEINQQLQQQDKIENIISNQKISKSKLITENNNYTPNNDTYIERDTLEKDYTDDFINNEIKSHEEPLDENELTSIHNTIRVEDENQEIGLLPKNDVQEEEEPCQKFDLKEFLKENTRDEIYCQNESENDNEDLTNYYNEEKNDSTQSPPKRVNKYLTEDLEYEEIQPFDPAKAVHKSSYYSKNENNNQVKKDNRLIILENEEDPST